MEASTTSIYFLHRSVHLLSPWKRYSSTRTSIHSPWKVPSKPIFFHASFPILPFTSATKCHCKHYNVGRSLVAHICNYKYERRRASAMPKRKRCTYSNGWLCLFREPRTLSIDFLNLLALSLSPCPTAPSHPSTTYDSPNPRLGRGGRAMSAWTESLASSPLAATAETAMVLVAFPAFMSPCVT